MGNITEGKTYVKGTQRTIQPYVASNIDNYKSKVKVASSSNIYTTSRLGSVIPSQSNFAPKRIFKDDLTHINDEGYNFSKYQLKKMPFKKLMDISMV